MAKDRAGFVSLAASSGLAALEVRPASAICSCFKSEHATVCAKHQEMLLPAEIQDCSLCAHFQVILNGGKGEKKDLACSECTKTAQERAGARDGEA